MKIKDDQITQINQMIDSGKTETQIIDWVDSQENSQDIYDWFNKFMQGYVSST
ncbi:hypothetical protein [Phormidium tenue]|uniref:Uncharacterized protein n=1 Tax=Phormidium tenue FACHB-1050 TaxID=2692857 RepID=A0ABR8C7V1_9CYAN|nr:hypothetical protein [Phormidium tenue]MBD2316676.1 hypothetical protein [Phormidium tenue FACHB-1050]